MGVRPYRKIHRYLGIIVGIQLLFWTGSGFFFSLNPIEKVRGETEQADPRSLDATAFIASPGSALQELRDTYGDIELLSVLLRPHLDGQIFEIAYRESDGARWALADADTGHLRQPIDANEASAIARQDFTTQAEISSVDFIENVDSDSEYRGGPLPAYRVSFDHALGTRIYVSVDRAPSLLDEMIAGGGSTSCGCFTSWITRRATTSTPWCCRSSPPSAL